MSENDGCPCDPGSSVFAPVGSDEELQQILERQEALLCTRVWEAWQYKTMRETDFVQVAEDEDCVAEYLQWRDGAVETFRAALVAALLSQESQVMGLGPNDGPLLGLLADFVADFDPGRFA